MTTTLLHTQAQVDGFKQGKQDALTQHAPLYTYPADLALYASDDYVAGYVDGYESVTDPV